eukprot:CAMPEP_0197689344 /NCGR_PEP_ID=MMETSP1338-20131121/106707_1 /TAXON_ID=43686 ORGANISM="Pelagodinium beii, Strain RCC1491" /NCGR_SAMPLE_ID=MMETSP1338 /ASSEMBLY_ACC=CAM_ASM_000754 /LENGTH=56 /DNA_ID=CAMNT_0043271669 /DNA_START=60 /DNA_END=226 /DNA_ORIENTATION=+
MADALLAGDMYDATGHLSVVAASGDFYFSETDFSSLEHVLPSDDWEAETWSAAEAA